MNDADCITSLPYFCSIRRGKCLDGLSHLYQVEKKDLVIILWANLKHPLCMFFVMYIWKHHSLSENKLSYSGELNGHSCGWCACTLKSVIQWLTIAIDFIESYICILDMWTSEMVDFKVFSSKFCTCSLSETHCLTQFLQLLPQAPFLLYFTPF